LAAEYLRKGMTVKMNRQTDRFTLIRYISRNAVIRKILPYMVQEFFWGFVLKNQGEKLRKRIIEYYNDNVICLTDKMKESIDFLKKNKNGFYSVDFLKIWLKEDNKGEGYFDFNGAKLPNISRDAAQMASLLKIFQDTFLFSCLLNDNYSKEIVRQFDPCMMEGPYGYIDDDFDVTIKEKDIVMDVGAWIGDFSAYAAARGAIAYAFEPVCGNYDLLLKTAELNAPGAIIPIKRGLGDIEKEMEININESDSSGNSMYFGKNDKKETIKITTLDKFVENKKIKRIDFIKADIEGAERYLLRGASMVLKKFAPKLAICTYHSIEDPELLEKIIVDSNPEYRVAHTRQKLFARVR
jgi:FkbM family methyltransferase